MASVDLEDVVVVLTGGTSGIGRQAANRLAERGATVAVVGRDRERGEELIDSNSDIRLHRADLSTQAAVRELAADLCESDDRLDVLAHNAGLSAPGPRPPTASSEPSPCARISQQQRHSPHQQCPCQRIPRPSAIR